MGRKRKDGNDLPQRMYLRSGTYYYVDTSNRWHNLGRDLTQAKTQLATHVRPVLEESFAELSRRYLEQVSVHKAPRTYYDHRVYAKHLNAVFGHMEVDRIKPFDIAKYHDLRGEEARVRANRELSFLKCLFIKAIRWGMIERSPAENIAKFPESARDRYPTDREFMAVYRQASLTVRDAMEFVYFTAMSPCDMLKITVDMLTVSGVNLGYRSKVAQRRATSKTLFAWNEHLLKLVQAMLSRPHRSSCPYLFQTEGGNKLSTSNLNKMFSAARKKAMVQDGIEPFHFYDLRAKSLTDAKNAGLNASLLGCHADERTTQIYLRRFETKAVETLTESPLTRTHEPFADGVDLRPMFPI